ncbi:MAG: bifunctional folylpolyglutamate synthase/dihydrofolate synthase [Armatimonadetes bacterium]|nr:bifunctional folylpolyglutamate synthase/dihydrofolate synthase [Armatimonadota bacterium]
MNFTEAIAYLDDLTKFGWKLGLERFEALCERFGRPQDRLRCLHVGGTNGKGSTCAMLSSALKTAGYRVGTYLSPYVYDIGERVQVNGQNIAHDDLARLITEIAPHVEAVASDPALGQPTEFEVKTLLGFLWLLEQRVDVAVVEVGLGGRLDATNVVNPLVSVITNVTADHTEILGETLPEIAREKGGIIKPGRPLVTASPLPEVLDVLQAICRDRGSPLIRAGEDSRADVRWERLKAAPGGQICRIHGRKDEYPDVGLKLIGAFQAANAATAVAALELVEDQGFPVSREALYRGLREADIPGRMAVLQTRPTLLVDGAHNPAAAEELARAVRDLFTYRRLFLVIGMLGRHSVEGVASALCPLADTVFASAPSYWKAAPPPQMADIASRYARDVRTSPGIGEAVRRALDEASPDDLVLVAGSLYNIGEVGR